MHALQEINVFVCLKTSKPDPHFSQLWDGARGPGFLEGGKIRTLSMSRISSNLRHEV